MYRFHSADEHSRPSHDLDAAELFSSVLLVEDDPAHAKLVSRALESIVGDVSCVHNGEEAIRAVQTSYFELVFCDLNLPDMSGLAVLKAIHDIRPSLPVIVLTSSSNIDDAVAAMKAGTWDYMVKQFTPDLHDRIKLVISTAAARKLQDLHSLQVRTERDAFWVAAQTALDGLAILGSEGSVVFANEAFRNFCSGASRDEEFPAGANVVDLIASHDYAVARDLRRQFTGKQGDSLWSSELRVVPLGGERKDMQRYFELTLSAMETSGFEDLALSTGSFRGLRRYVLWVRDITRRKDQERFQRDLLSTTTHDLKGPLGAILTSAELLADDVYSARDKSQELITRIASCARNSINIIDELLSARRIQDGVMVVTPRLYDLAEILEDVKLDYLLMAKSKAIDFTCRPVMPGMQIYADKMALVRVLGNLISNAIKFTPRNGQVKIAAERHGTEVQISVSDSGPGIESNARHLLFERYARLEKHQQIEGTGLGLFVTKNIVDAHNGRIQVQSQVGVGTTFIVSFPDLSSREQR